MIALGRDIEMMPLTHNHRRLVLAFHMAGKAAGVVGVVVALLTIERLVAGRRISNLQLVANLVRIAVLARAAKENPTVDVGSAGAEVHPELEIRVVIACGEPAACDLWPQGAIDNLPFCFALRHKVVQSGSVKEELPPVRLFLGGERVGRPILRG